MEPQNPLSLRKINKRIHRGIPEFEQTINRVTQKSRAVADYTLNERVLKSLFNNKPNWDLETLFKEIINQAPDADDETRFDTFEILNSTHKRTNLIQEYVFSKPPRLYYLLDQNKPFKEIQSHQSKNSKIITQIQECLYTLYNSNLKGHILSYLKMLKDSNIANAKIESTEKKITITSLVNKQLNQPSIKTMQMYEQTLRWILPQILISEPDNIFIQDTALQALSMTTNNISKYTIVLPKSIVTDSRTVLPLFNCELPDQYLGNINKTFRAFIIMFQHLKYVFYINNINVTPENISNYSFKLLKYYPLTDQFKTYEPKDFQKLNYNLIGSDLNENDLIVGGNILKDLILILDSLSKTQKISDIDFAKFGFYDTDQNLISFRGIPIPKHIIEGAFKPITSHILNHVKSLQPKTAIKAYFEHPTLNRFMFSYTSQNNSKELLVATILDKIQLNSLYYNGEEYVYRSNETNETLLTFKSNATNQTDLEISLQTNLSNTKSPKQNLLAKEKDHLEHETA